MTRVPWTSRGLHHPKIYRGGLHLTIYRGEGDCTTAPYNIQRGTGCITLQYTCNERETVNKNTERNLEVSF